MAVCLLLGHRVGLPGRWELQVPWKPEGVREPRARRASGTQRYEKGDHASHPMWGTHCATSLILITPAGRSHPLRFPDKETEAQGDRWLAQCRQAAMQQSQALTPGLVTHSLPSQTLMRVDTGPLLCQGRLLGRQIDPQKPCLCGTPGAESCRGERESWRAAT